MVPHGRSDIEGRKRVNRSIVHVVATNNFAGVERYITYVAPLQAAAGWNVTVVGGERDSMRRALGTSVRHFPGSTVNAAAAQVSGLGRRVDVVHAHMTAAEFAALLAWPIARPKLVSTRHFAARRGSSPAVNLSGRFIRYAFAEQISISQFVADTIHEPSILIPNGVPDVAAVTGTGRRVLVAQRMETEKDTQVALEAWAKSGLGADGWTLAFAGRGAEEQHLRTRTHELGLEDSVEFLGFVDDLQSEMATAGIFLATALAEPFGLSVVEAMAHGLPVIASAAGAHRETVGSVAPELLFAPGDSDACALLLRQVAGSPNPEWGARLQERQREAFSLTRHVGHVLELYTRVLADT